MRIAINCRSILKQNATGIGRYAHQLLMSLGKIDAVNEYHLYALKQLFDFKRRLPDFPYVNFHRHYDFLGRGLYQTVGEVDICHVPSPDQLPPKKSKLIVTVHDLIHRTYPDSQSAETTRLVESQMQQVVKQADHIICISHATRRDLHQFYQLPMERSSVVYNGVNHDMFYPLQSVERPVVQEMIKAKGIDQPYILYVGTIEPRKNLHGILKSFAQFCQKTSFPGYLVVVGMKGWMIENIEPLIKELGLTDKVKFLGYVTDDQLRVFYQLARVFVFPSFYEGFGFPIVEAFACGVPVITSHNSSCAEIAGDCAITVDPHNQQALADAMGNLVNDEKLRQHYMSKGLAHAQQFSFDQTARQTQAIYKGLIA